MTEKILSFYQDAKKLMRGEMVLPRMVSVWLSNYCFLSCNYCLYSSVHEKTLINGEKFRVLLKELSDLGIESVEFSGGGESTIHKECFEFAEFIKGLGMKVGLLTNGFHFDLDRIKYFDYIRVGLDAKDKKTYSEIKGVKEEVFDKVVYNIKQVIEKRNEDISVVPDVGVKFIINENNYKEMPVFISFVKELGADHINFRKLFVKEDLEKNLEVESIFLKVKFLYGDYVYGSFSFEELENPCFMAPIHAVITADGSLLNCCYFNDKEHIIGNVLEKSFKKVWFSSKHWKILESIGLQECNKYTCRFRNYNNKMSYLLKGGDFISFI